MKSLKNVLAAILCFAAVVSAQIWNSATPPTVADGATITIAAGVHGNLNVPENATITIIGGASYGGGMWDEQLVFDIPATSKVIWKAEFSGGVFSRTPGIVSFANVLIRGGELVVAEGGVITGVRTVLGVRDGGRITIDGGEVRATGGEAIFSRDSSSIVILSGVVSMTGSNAATISVLDSGSVAISGGLVIGQTPFGYDANRTNINITNNGAVVKIEENFDWKTYTAGTKDGFTTTPENAAVYWGGGGISYPNGFWYIEYDLIEDRPQRTIVWDRWFAVNPSNPGNHQPALIDGDTVRIALGANGTLRVPGNRTITIIGDNLNNSPQWWDRIALEIAPTSRVIWRATFTPGDMWMPEDGFRITGGGVFEFAAGSIRTCRRAIIVSDGGTFIASGGNITGRILLESGSTLNFLGGRLESTHINNNFEPTIAARGGSTVNISGGEISVINGTGSLAMVRQAILIADSSNITVSGGVINTIGSVEVAIRIGTINVDPTNERGMGNIVISGGVINIEANQRSHTAIVSHSNSITRISNVEINVKGSTSTTILTGINVDGDLKIDNVIKFNVEDTAQSQQLIRVANGNLTVEGAKMSVGTNGEVISVVNGNLSILNSEITGRTERVSIGSNLRRIIFHSNGKLTVSNSVITDLGDSGDFGGLILTSGDSEITFEDGAKIIGRIGRISGVSNITIKDGAQVLGRIDATTVNVFGGVVSYPDNNWAISSPSLTISGGLVISGARIACRVINTCNIDLVPNDDVLTMTGGTIIGYDRNEFSQGTRNGLVSFPEDADIFWGVSGGVAGIFYPGGFYPVDGIVPPSFIRERQPVSLSQYGILLENAVVSDVARFSIITPEPAMANVRIFDALGNVVWSVDDVGAYCIRPATMTVGDLGVCNTPLQWDLTNTTGRLVASGTYIIAVEATTISGRRYRYSARIGVKR
ncbi:MAG: hypothetical protein FWE23_08075 [Chitinivibrionia bacterium]|nr:hypothetical protein [Chitinivibrionia bacterium]